MLDAYRPVIEGYLDEDERAGASKGTPRAASGSASRRARRRLQRVHRQHYVHDLKVQRRGVAESYLDLVWTPARRRPTSARPTSPSSAQDAG